MGASVRPERVEPLYQGDDPDILADIADIRAAAQRAGRDPAPLVARYLVRDAGFAAPGAATAVVAPKGRGSLINTALQGVFQSASDEMIGGIEAGIDKVFRGDTRPLGDIYRARVAEERARLAGVREENPILAPVSEVAGGIAGGFGAARALPALGAMASASTVPGVARAAAPVARAVQAAGRTLPGRMALGSAGGGVGGAVSGFNAAEGSVAERMAGAARGGTAGVVVGGLVPLAGRAIAQLRDALGVRRAEALVPTSAQADATGTAGAAGGGGGAMSGPVSGPPGDRMGRLARIAQRALQGGETAADRADVKVLEALTAKGQTLDTVEQAARATAGRGKPVALVDVGGRRAQRLARGARTGTGGEVLDEVLGARAAAQPQRLVEDVEGVFGTRLGIPQRLDELIAARKAAADPAYQAARAAGVEVRPESREQVATLQRILTKPQFRQVYQQARALADLEDDALPEIFEEAADGTVRLATIPDVRTLDYLKRGVDAVIERGGAQGTGLARDEARVLRRRLNEVLAVYDDLVPEYGAARRTFAGAKALETAFRAATEGTDELLESRLTPFMQASADDVRAALARMTPGEADAYRQGAVESIRRTLDGMEDGRDQVRKLFGTPAMRDKLRAIFPDEASWNDFTARMGDERTMRGSFDFLRGNSQTADKLVDMAEASDAGAMITGNGGGFVRGLVDGLTRRAVQGQSENIAEGIARRMTLGGGGNLQEVVDYLGELRRLQRRLGAQGATRATATGAGVGGYVGGALGGP